MADIQNLSPTQLSALDAEDPNFRVLAPVVKTTVNPERDLLMQARAEVMSDEHCRTLFNRFRKEGHSVEWLRDSLTIQLAALWNYFDPELIGKVRETAQYLADEYDQIGEGTFLVSTSSGRVEAVLQEKDFWQGPPVPRESGNMATPLPRIRPDIEAFLTTWHFDREREQRILGDAAIKLEGTTTQLLVDEGDPRLAMTTKAGRKASIAPLSEENPVDLLYRVGGASRAFLGCFEVLGPEDEVPPGLTPLLPVTVTARSRLSIAEPGSFSPSFNRAAQLRGSIPQGWIRDLAYAISLEAYSHSAAFRDPLLNEVNPDVFVVSPDLVRYFQRQRQQEVPSDNGGLSSILPVDGARPIALYGLVGVIRVPERHELGSLELGDQWYVASALNVEVFINWTLVGRLEPLEIEPVEAPVEVVR